MTIYCGNAKYLFVMSAKYYTNDKLELRIPALQYGKLAIQAAQQGVDISKLIIREAAERRKGENAHSATALPPVPAPMPAAGATGMPRPVVVSGADPDLKLR